MWSSYSPSAMMRDDEINAHCTSCGSQSLTVDWRAGDRVCTECGTVNLERIIDTSHEWRDFNDVDDIVKNLPAAARCGLIPNDESRYVGGLQPTTLSKQPYGGTFACGSNHRNEARHRSLAGRLKYSHGQIDKMVDERNKNMIKDADIARKVLMKARKAREKIDAAKKNNHLDTEEERNLEEVASSVSAQSSLSQKKWCLERSLLLYGTIEEATSAMASTLCNPSIQDFNLSDDALKTLEAEKKKALSAMDRSHRVASRDLYRGYKFLSHTVQVMKLPESLKSECLELMCMFVTKKNGFHLKGIRTSERSPTIDDGDSKSCDVRKKKNTIEETLREKNALRQTVSLLSALVFVLSKKIGMGRNLQVFCHDMERVYSSLKKLHPSMFSFDFSTTSAVGPMFKSKIITRGVAELKNECPQIFRDLHDPSISAANLVHCASSKLNLPAAATGCIQKLAMHCGKEQVEKGIGTGVRPSVLCASVIYFVCTAGGIMQLLAKQALHKSQTSKRVCEENKETEKTDGISHVVQSGFVASKKRISDSKVSLPTKKARMDTSQKEEIPEQVKSNEDVKLKARNLDEDPYEEIRISTASASDNLNRTSTFDALSSEPVVATSKDNELETLKGWFSWDNQNDWSRKSSEIKLALEVSTTAMSDFYKRFLHPRRSHYLNIVQSHLATCEDAEMCYLVNIGAAAPLMKIGQT